MDGQSTHGPRGAAHGPGRYPSAVKAKDLRDLVHFSPDGPRHEELWESERLWAEVICLDRNQQHGPVGDPGSDAVCLVAAGEVVTQVGRGRKRLRQWASVLVPAGEELTVTNAADEPAVILLVAAPPPPPSSPRLAE